MLTGLIAVDGSTRHPHVRRLLAPRPSRRDLSDAVHALCTVHGGHPGMIDEASKHCAQPDACDWLAVAARGFAGERAMLVRLSAAVGPLPSTPGQAETEGVLVGMRHALGMLAQSDRGGCATGAVAALVMDWETVRQLLAVAADCFGAELAPSRLPAAGVNAAAVAMLGDTPATERAMGFGVRQLLGQQYGLWNLLEARAAAREPL
ncbi:hypothetical protein JAO74_04365 [Sphingomonas sp. BT553]|uniref:Uncharacterized protein n=2 Tax=Sphingomonas mollis TaxID=2795726 RepID=A0ABS0XLV6_9SPHN|nr:hypothetical protein [Sphingomonas sp. BT553]